MNIFDQIVLVDDDPIFGFITEQIVNTAGVTKQLTRCQNGVEAIDFFKALEKSEQKNEKVLLLLDLNMPVMDGWGFLEEIENHDVNEDLIIYILSSSINDRDREKAKNYKWVRDFISKPITEDLLKIMVEKHCNASKL